MSLIWKSPFNKIVRSEEALIIGIALGVILGVSMLIFTPVHVHKEPYNNAATLCGGVDKVKEVDFTYTGKQSKVVCTTGLRLTDF